MPCHPLLCRALPSCAVPSWGPRSHPELCRAERCHAVDLCAPSVGVAERCHPLSPCPDRAPAQPVCPGSSGATPLPAEPRPWRGPSGCTEGRGAQRKAALVPRAGRRGGSGWVGRKAVPARPGLPRGTGTGAGVDPRPLPLRLPGTAAAMLERQHRDVPAARGAWRATGPVLTQVGLQERGWGWGWPPHGAVSPTPCTPPRDPRPSPAPGSVPHALGQEEGASGRAGRAWPRHPALPVPARPGRPSCKGGRRAGGRVTRRGPPALPAFLALSASPTRPTEPLPVAGAALAGGGRGRRACGDGDASFLTQRRAGGGRARGKGCGKGCSTAGKGLPREELEQGQGSGAALEARGAGRPWPCGEGGGRIPSGAQRGRAEPPVAVPPSSPCRRLIQTTLVGASRFLPGKRTQPLALFSARQPGCGPEREARAGQGGCGPPGRAAATTAVQGAAAALAPAAGPATRTWALSPFPCPPSLLPLPSAPHSELRGTGTRCSSQTLL